MTVVEYYLNLVLLVEMLQYNNLVNDVKAEEVEISPDTEEPKLQLKPKS